MKIKAVSSTAPITRGKSNLSSASTVIFPMPFQPKIYSIKKEPANNSASQPDTAVITGLSALGRAWRKMVFVFESPLAYAVRI